MDFPEPLFIGLCRQQHMQGLLPIHNLFLEATQRFHSPRRVRCDHGTENVNVVRWMLYRRIIASNPVIAGPHVHNHCGKI